MAEPTVTLVVHPVDTCVHPSYPEGWRWAVMVDGGPTDLDACVGALMCTTEAEAALIGEQCVAAVVKALRRFGIPARHGALRLDYDPIPAEADQQPLGALQAGDK